MCFRQDMIRFSLAGMTDDAGTATAFLDRPIARLCALGIAISVVAFLGYLHRDDLFPPEVDALAAQDPVALCLAPRAADIDEMQAEGTITEAQAALFKERAKALCQAQTAQ